MNNIVQTFFFACLKKQKSMQNNLFGVRTGPDCIIEIEAIFFCMLLCHKWRPIVPVKGAQVSQIDFCYKRE
jgi:hypothetical protein